MPKRDKNRDKNEARAPLRASDRSGARGADANPTGPERNDRTRNRPKRDEHDIDLEQYDRERLD